MGIKRVPEALFAIPGDLRSPTGGYAYDRRLLEMLPDFGVKITHLALADSFPNPTQDDIDETIACIAECGSEPAILFDGLAYGALPPSAVAAIPNRIIALVHHPLFLETGLPHRRKSELKETETSALAAAECVIATSQTTARILQDQLALGRDRIIVAEPGTDPVVRATGTGSPLSILAVGTVLPRKGYETLVEALVPLKDMEWHLTIAGALDAHPETVQQIKSIISDNGLSERVTLAGKVVPATLDHYYESADIFVSASLFEGYGMSLAEAMARGLPIIVATGGAAGFTANADATLHVEPGDVGQLTNALKRMMTDKRLRKKLADAAWEAGRKLPTWQETARRIAAVILGLKL